MIHFRISKEESEALKVEIEALDEFLKCENESRKIEITSLDNFITMKYPEKVSYALFSLKETEILLFHVFVIIYNSWRF